MPALDLYLLNKLNNLKYITTMDYDLSNITIRLGKYSKKYFIISQPARVLNFVFQNASLEKKCPIGH